MTLQTNELRTGNYFKWKPIASMGSGVDIISQHNHYHYTELKEPIPLTEEILLKCGAKIKEVDAGFGIGYYNSITIGDYTLTGISRGKWGILDIDCKPFEYLHQFQNLIFVLTGEELEVKL